MGSMKILYQWALKNPTEWQEVDSKDWHKLSKRPVPKKGELGGKDNVPGWIRNVNVQGITTEGYDHIAIDPITVGNDEGIKLTAWNDDPDDAHVNGIDDWINEPHAIVWTILPLAPDPKLGMAINTRQSCVIYCTGERYNRLEPNPPQNTTVRPWFEFIAADAEITRHGVWIEDTKFRQHLDKAPHDEYGWMHFNEHLPESEVELIKGRRVLKEQRKQGRYRQAQHTITYYKRTTDRAVGYATATHEDALELTTAASATESVTTNATTVLSWTWTAPANQPNVTDWPSGAFHHQVNVAAASAGITYGPIGGGAIQFNRINSALTSVLDSQSAGGGAISGTGLKLFTTFADWDSGSGSASDVYAIRLSAAGTSHGDAITLTLNTTDSYADGPWTAGVSDLTINKSDNATITELVDVLQSGARDVTETENITITESIGRMLESNRSVSDNISLSESTKVEITSFITETENITLTENVDLQSATISGTIVPTATEDEIVSGGKTTIITLLGDTWIAAGALSFDLQRQNIINGITSAQSEATGWNLVPQASQSVNGVVRTSDTVVTITWDAFPTYNITAPETITTTVPGSALSSGLAIVGTPTFTISTVVPTLSINKSENITVTENVSLLLSVELSVSDSSTITESTKLEINSFINKSDSITVTENRSLLIPDLYSVVADSVTVTESLKAELTSFINKNESIALTENVDPELMGFVNVSDTATLTENIDPEVVSRISVTDTPTITENAVVLIEAGVADLSVSKSETITVTESLKEELTSFINKSENVTTTESLAVRLESLVTKSDSITITESHSEILQSFVSKSETATITESVSLLEQSSISKSEAITVAEAVSILLPALNINKSENITVSESIQRVLESFVVELESITITETIVGLLTSTIAKSETITITELIQALVLVNIVASENINITESGSVALVQAGTPAITISETITVSESSQLALTPLYISKSESITVSESLDARIPSTGNTRRLLTTLGVG